MNELETLKIRFSEIYKDRPSAIRTTVFFGPVGWVTRIIGSLFSIAGIGLLIATFMGQSLLQLADMDEKISSMREAYEQIVLCVQTISGIACLIIGITLAIIGGLCRRIVRRNFYILELEELFGQNKVK